MGAHGRLPALGARYLKLASLLAAAAAGGCLTALAAIVAPVSAAGDASPWSPPATLSACPAGAAARVVFPSDSPSHATGAGAIVWSASSACPGGAGARVAPLGAGDEPAPSAIPRTAAGRAIAPRGSVIASAAPHGQIVIAGASPRIASASPSAPSPGAAPDGLAIEGAAGGTFSPLLVPGGAVAPMALGSAYLGDVALAAAPSGAERGGALDVHLQRFFSQGFTHDVAVRAPGAGAVQALTLALDYRGEVLAVWAQGGEIYARVVSNEGARRALQRLAPVGARPRLTAVLSDDDRAIVAWSDQQGAQTSVYIDRSAVGVRFGAPQLLERFRDPDDLPAPAASPSLVRLSSEGVVLAWAGSADGHWVVRAAPVDLNGVQGIDTIAAPGGDALLADLAAGPDGDALVLWTEPPPSTAGVVDVARQAIFAARATEEYAGGIAFDEPEQVAPAGPVGDASMALDPQSDRAVAVWQGAGGAIEYSIRGDASDP
jgi:hypothetical protein